MLGSWPLLGSPSQRTTFSHAAFFHLSRSSTYFLFPLQGMHEAKCSPELILLALFLGALLTSGSSAAPFHLVFLTSLKTGCQLFMFSVRKVKYFCKCSYVQAESCFPYVCWVLAYLLLFPGMKRMGHLWLHR